MTLEQNIERFVAHVNQLVVDHYAARNYKMTPALYRLQYGEKWCKIVAWEARDKIESRAELINDVWRVPTSVYCFICMKDGVTKTLGVLKAGDIHKAASWQAPAKTARGSVFALDFDRCATPYGVTSLR